MKFYKIKTQNDGTYFISESDIAFGLDHSDKGFGFKIKLKSGLQLDISGDDFDEIFLSNESDQPKSALELMEEAYRKNAEIKDAARESELKPTRKRTVKKVARKKPKKKDKK